MHWKKDYRVVLNNLERNSGNTHSLIHLVIKISPFYSYLYSVSINRSKINFFLKMKRYDWTIIDDNYTVYFPL
jgi:hypothetical protein